MEIIPGKITGAPLPAGKLQFSTLALLRFNVVSYHCCNMLKIVIYLYIASLWNISENISSGNTSMVVKAFLKLIFVRLKKYYCFRKCGWRKTFSSRRRPIFFNQSNWIFKKFFKEFCWKIESSFLLFKETKFVRIKLLIINLL